MWHIKPVTVLESFWIVTHSYAASYSIKACLDKTTDIFNTKTRAIYLNPLIAYESKLKIKVTSPWKFCKLCLRLQLFTIEILIIAALFDPLQHSWKLLQYSSSYTTHHMLQYLFIYPYSIVHLSIPAAIFHPAREIINILTIANSNK